MATYLLRVPEERWCTTDGQLTWKNKGMAEINRKLRLELVALQLTFTQAWNITCHPLSTFPEPSCPWRDDLHLPFTPSATSWTVLSFCSSENPLCHQNSHSHWNRRLLSWGRPRRWLVRGFAWSLLASPQSLPGQNGHWGDFAEQATPHPHLLLYLLYVAAPPHILSPTCKNTAPIQPHNSEEEEGESLSSPYVALLVPEDKGSGDRSLGLNPTSVAWLLYTLWGKLLNSSLPQSPHLCNGENKSRVTELLWGVDRLIYGKHRDQCLACGEISFVLTASLFIVLIIIIIF